MVSPNTKKEILKMATEIAKARASAKDEWTTKPAAENLVEYINTVYKGLKSLCEKEGIN